MKDLVTSSPQMEQVRSATRRSFESKYPWKEIKVGQSFVVKHSEVKKTSLYPMVTKASKKHNKKFRVVDHGPDIGYEVGCIPMTLPEAAQGGSLIDALNNLKEGE